MRRTVWNACSTGKRWMGELDPQFEASHRLEHGESVDPVKTITHMHVVFDAQFEAAHRLEHGESGMGELDPQFEAAHRLEHGESVDPVKTIPPPKQGYIDCLCGGVPPPI